MPRIDVRRLRVGKDHVNCYLVENTENDGLFIVDPGADADAVIRAANGRRAAAVLLTHGHFDHIGAADRVCRYFEAPLYIHEADVPKLTDCDANVGAAFGRFVTVETKPVPLHGGEVLDLGGMRVGVLHTPGHSAGGVCYVLPEGQGVLCGDTLFAHGYGRTDFPDGDFHLLRKSLRILFHLTPRQPCYPGHEEPGMTGRDPAAEGE